MAEQVPTELRIGNETFKTEELIGGIADLIKDLGENGEEKLKEMEKLAHSIGTANLHSMNPEEAMKLLSTVGVKPEDLLRRVRRLRTEKKHQNKPAKVGPNERCPCNSGKKYKKCCRLVLPQETQKEIASPKVETPSE